MRRERARSGVAARKHGEGGRNKRSAEYDIWRAMKSRCYYTRHIGYMHYGGRGITVCDSWRNSYDAFIADMGRRPSDHHSIDRIDNDGPYSPQNCRWATTQEQARDKDFGAMGRKGGAARWATMTAAEKSALNKMANAARFAKQTPEVRRAIAANALRARWHKTSAGPL